MHFTPVISILVVMFVSVRSEHMQHIKKHMDYTKAEPADCNQHRPLFASTVTSSQCVPVNMHVPLKPMPWEVYRPSVVYVKRCSGHCSLGLNCMPTETKMIKKLISVMSRHDTMNRTCALVEVEEHTSCKCECLQKEKYCNSKQIWMEKRCACVCKNREVEREKCENQIGMLWDDDTCSCSCTNMNMSDLCTTNSKWDKEQCRCV